MNKYNKLKSHSSIILAFAFLNDDVFSWILRFSKNGNCSSVFDPLVLILSVFG